MPQKDQLCGPFWGALALTAFGHPTEVEQVARRAGSTLAMGDPSNWLPPGAKPRADYRFSLPVAVDETSAGTSARGLARAVEELSGAGLAAVPVAGPWNGEMVELLIRTAHGADIACVLIANLRTGCLWGARPCPNILLDYLLGRTVAGPEPDWDAGHFLQVLACVRGPGGALVVLRDTYPQLGWDGHHLQPAKVVAAALERGDGSEGGILCVCGNSSSETLRTRLGAAGFDLRHWENGSMEAERTW